jgi:DNA-binding transcriptional MerR regulator
VTATQPSTAGKIRIGELAKRAGVARGTIQHYLREGLLPQPLKTHKNMAYYDPACVEQIRIIKELQEKSRLPLHEIREILASQTGTEALTSAIRHAQHAALDAVSSATKGAAVKRADAATHFDLPESFITQLVDHGIVNEQRDGDETVFKGADLEVLATLKELRAAGFNEDNGFQAADLVMYRQALEKLLEKEVATFMRVFASRGSMSPDLPQKAVVGASMLLVALRKKSVADFMQNVNVLVEGAR